jgi:hypothetical protein
MRTRNARTTIAGAVFAAVLFGAAMCPNSAAAGRGTVELELIGPKTYRWDGREYGPEAIAAALAEADAAQAIRTLVLIDPDGDTSIADAIDFALLAKPIGARAYRNVDGKLRRIEITLKP